MFDYFSLSLELGNEGMQSGPDVARGKIVDVNGNTVGEYGPTREGQAV